MHLHLAGPGPRQRAGAGTDERAGGRLGGRRAAEPLYDRIGGGYSGGGRPDPRIAARIEQALGAAASVVNVGAGPGSYEPAGRRVVAVEPSPVMAAQRSARAAPYVRGTAEALPFADEAFGAAMAILSLHHWTDKARGWPKCAGSPAVPW